MRPVMILFLPLITAQLPFDIFDIPAFISIPLFKIYSEVTKVETQCFKEILRTSEDLLLAGLTARNCKSLDCLKDETIKNASYALQMMASMGRPHSLDLDELALTYAGDPKLCKNIKAPFPTNYCFLHVKVDWKRINSEEYGMGSLLSHLPGGKMPEIEDALALNNVKVAFCMPASCRDDTDIGRILATITNDIARVAEIDCDGPKEEPNAFFYLINDLPYTIARHPPDRRFDCGFILTLIFITIASSFLDYWAANNGMHEQLSKNAGWKVLMAFSLPRNSQRVFSLQREPDALLCLDALRFISFTWVASLHSVLFAAEADNAMQVFRESDYFFSSIILNAVWSVDTFFLISGLLVSYMFFKKVHKDPEHASSRRNWILYYVHRWLRLTPAYLLFIGIYVTWTPRMHGAWAIGTAQNTSYYVERCEDTWWMNVLYIQNFQSMNDMCYSISWFLSVDMQLYWIAPLFLLAIYYSWKTGFAAVLGGILLSTAAIVFLTAHFDLPATAFVIKEIGNVDFVSHIYVKPWTRCIPYLTGILCGYIIIQVQKKDIDIRRPKLMELIVCWLLAIASALTVIFSVYDYARGQSDWSIAVRAVYGSLSRIGWSAAVAWVVMACTFDWAGPVKTLLEHPLWYPLGRLSYCAYLTHWFLLHYLLNLGDGAYLTITIPVVFLSSMLALVWTCLVEIPFMSIEVIVVDILMNKTRRNHSTNVMNVAHPTGHPQSVLANQESKANNASHTTAIEVNN